MKLLSICNPNSYKRPSLDIPIYYQQLSRDIRVKSFHLPTEKVAVQKDLSLKLQVAPISGELSYEGFLNLGALVNQELTLTELDLIFCRTLKPFPPGYLDILARWEQQVKFVNSPTGIREQIQPDFLLKAARKYIPEMIVTEDWREALAFFEQQQTIVAKLSNSCGGRGVFKICYQNNCFQVDNLFLGTKEFKDFVEVMNYLQGTNKDPLQFVRYLKGVDAGDKRIVVVDGEIYGAYIRCSQSGHWVHNVSGDGECFLAEISEGEKEAIAGTFEYYRHRGIHTLGYDFLLNEDNDWCISEINAGNVGGFSRLEQLTNKAVMKQLITWLIEFANR